MSTAKKTLSILLSILLIAAVIPMASVPAFAEPEPEFIWAYDAETETLTITGAGVVPAGPVSMDQLEDEADLADYVADYPHPEYMNAKHLVLSEGITGIGDMTFFLYKMETVSFPSTLESIGEGAFAYCAYLSGLTLPASLRSIGNYAFVMCPQLHTLTLPEGLVSLGEYAFGECTLNELHIPASLQLTEFGTDLNYYFITNFLTALYNASETAVLSSGVYNLGTAEAAEDAALRLGLLMTGQVMIMTSEFYGVEDPTPEQMAALLLLYADFAAYVNQKLGTDYTVETVADVEALMDALYPAMESAMGTPAYFTVYCTETGAQHAACADAGYRHKIFGSDAFCLNEVTFSGSENGLTWVVDPDARTLTIGGSGSLAFADGAPWSSAATYFDTVLFTADCAVTAFDFGYNTDPFAGCGLLQITLPASLTEITDAALSMLVQHTAAFNVAQGSTVYYAENGLLYQTLTAEKRTALVNEGLAPGADALMLLRVPRTAQNLVISSRTAVILPYAVYYNRNITGITIPDSVLSIEKFAIRSNDKLQSVAIGSGVKLLFPESIMLRTYTGSPVITVSADNPWLTADEKCVYSQGGKNLVMLTDPENVETLTLGEEVCTHEEGVFSYTYALRTLTVLNPYFDLNSSGLRPDTVVYGYDGSPAQQYCDTFGIRFIVIETDEIESVEILTPPTVTAYTVGDTLCLDGLQLTVNFAGGGSAVRASGYEVSDCDMSAAGEKTVAVTYGGKTAQFTVTVGETAPVYEIRVGESLNLLLLPSENYSYDYTADVKFVCEEDGAPYPSLSNYLKGASWNLQLLDENREKITDLYGWDEDYVFEAGRTYYFRCRIYVGRTDANHAATLTLFAEHDHNADTYTRVTNPPTCTSIGAEGTYCAVCGKYLGGRTLEKLPHDVDDDGYCTICGKLFRYTIGDGEAKAFVTKQYNSGDQVIGVYTAAETKTVTVTVMQNDNYGGPFIKRGGETYTNYTWDNDMHTATFTVAVQAGDVLEIGVCPAWREDTIVVAVDHTHNFVQQGETVDPTCSSYGFVPYRCDGCGVSFRKTLYMTPHTPDGVYEEVMQEPSCGLERNGYRYLRCSVCGETYYDELLWEHTDADRNGVCDVCGRSTGTWLTLNETVSYTAEGQGYKHFPFTAPADGDYFFTANSGTYYANCAVMNMGDRYIGGVLENNGIRFSLTAGETCVFCAYCYDITDYTVTVTDIHRPEAVEEVPATCTENGNIAYWRCAICGKLFADEACETEIAPEDTVVSGGHTLEYMPEIEAFCDAPGRQDYWHCTVCQKNFWDQACTSEITNMDNLTVYTMHHMTKTPGVAATCEADGSREYWYCSSCHKKYADSVGLELIENDADLVIPGGHIMTEHPGAQATCTEDGNLPYYSCERCGNFYIDALGENLIADRSEVILPAHHTLTAHAAADPGCETPGNIAYWTCDVCTKVFADADAQTEISLADTVLPARHALVRTAPKAATCNETGNIEYWTCSACGGIFSDANCRNRITEAETVIGKSTQHTWDAGRVTLQPTCLTAGQKTYTCTVCGKTRKEDVEKLPHKDDNRDGLCDYGCGTEMGGGEQPTQPTQPSQPSGDDLCPLCGERHTGVFGKIVAFFHRIVYFFKNLFSR